LTNQLTPEQINKLRDLALRVSPQKPWNDDLVAKAAYECALDLPQLLDAYEEADKTAQAYKLMNQTNHRARSELEAQLSEAQQLLLDAIEVLRVFDWTWLKIEEPWRVEGMKWLDENCQPLLDKLKAHTKEADK
jgi:hypothetical protein